MKRKMDRPERADFLRVFARHLLTDEAYETLSREEWGSVFLLMLHQWTKGGTLPDDQRKLCVLARCTLDEYCDLLTRWPKIQPVQDQPGRVGIPYIVHEWEQVMAFYQDQSARGKASAESRKAKAETMVPPEINHGSNHGSLETQPGLDSGSNRNSTNQEKEKEKEKDQEQTNGKALAPSEDELQFLSRSLEMWPKIQPKSTKSVPPSSPMKTVIQRWLHWTRTKKIPPATLYLACWHYQDQMVSGGHFLKALMNFLSSSAGLVDEHLEWAKAEAAKQEAP